MSNMNDPHDLVVISRFHDKYLIDRDPDFKNFEFSNSHV